MEIKEYIKSGIIESYVLGLASAEEAADLEIMMQKHAEVKQAVDAFAEALEQNILRETVTPPAEIKQKIISALFTAEQVKTPSSTTATYTLSTQETPVVKLNFWKYAAAASVVLFLISAAFNYYFYNSYQSANGKYQALLTERTSMQASINVMQTHLEEMTTGMHIMNNTETRKIKMSGTPGHETSFATVYWDTQSRNVYVMADKLPKAPEGKQYQLWAIVNGKPVDAGMVSDCTGNFCKMKNIPEAQAFAITLEKQGGSVAPSLDQMYTMGNV